MAETEALSQPLYQAVVTIQAPFNEPVDMNYCQPTTDRCTALAALTSAFDLHSRPDGYTFLVSVRIDVTNQEIPA
jgi:hypothetical protein